MNVPGKITTVLIAFGLAATVAVPLLAKRAGSDAIAEGKRVYDAHCQVCHGTDGRGGDLNWKRPLPGPGLRYPPPPLDHSAHAWHHADGLLQRIIEKGGEDGRMPGWKEKLSNFEIQAVIRYLHTLWEPKQLQWQQEQSGKDPLRNEP